MTSELSVFDDISDSNFGTAIIDHARNPDGSLANTSTRFGRKARNVKMDQITVGGTPAFQTPPTPSLGKPKPPARKQPLPAPNSLDHAKVSDDKSPQRPDPIPLQQQKLPHPPNPTPPETSQEASAPKVAELSRPAATVPVLAPTYEVGLILAKEAEAHLEQKKAAIGKALQKADRNITEDHWIGQVGFMRGRAGFESKEQGRHYGRESQIILITVFNSWTLDEKSWKKLVDRLSKEIAFYGVLTWGDKKQVLTPTYVPQAGVQGMWPMFRKGCGTTERGTFIPSDTLLPFCIRTSNHDDSEGPLSLETDQELKMERQADGSTLIEFKKLALKGPAGYRLKNVRVCFASECVCYFSNVRPAARLGSDNGAKVTFTKTDTEKDATTTNVKIEGASKSGVKAEVGHSWTKGHEEAVAAQFSLNALRIDIKQGRDQVVITYSPDHDPYSHPSDRRNLVLQGTDDDTGYIPRVTAYPGGDGSRLIDIKVATLSKWVLDESPTVPQAGLTKRLLRGVTGRREKAPIGYRKHSEVIFNTEVHFPQGNVARAAEPVICNLEQEF